MVVFFHEPNSLGRAKLRRLTIKREMTLQAIGDAIGYSRAAISLAACGHRAGTKLIRALAVLSDGEIGERDWQVKYRGNVDAIPIFEGRGRPRGNGTAAGERTPGGQEQRSRDEMHVAAVALAKRGMRLARRGLRRRTKRHGKPTGTR